jgi:hypothetical protein
MPDAGFTSGVTCMNGSLRPTALYVPSGFLTTAARQKSLSLKNKLNHPSKHLDPV